MTNPEDDFATLFEASTPARPLTRGQTVEGTIVRIGHDVALVDVGGKSEAVIDLAELKAPDGSLEAGVGERIQATVVSTAGGVTLSRRLARRAASDSQIEQAFHAGLPVEGTVQGVTKGGYDVRVGHSRAFCPFSQIDLARTADPADHVGRAYTFRIVEYSEGGRNLVVSRRAMIEAEQQAQADEVRRTLVPGAVVAGRVVSVREYGAFVDVGGGIQGLLHVSDMAWSRAADAAEAVRPGEAITVKVLRVDPETQKIALGLKQLGEDPWTSVATTFAVGQVHQGRVTRVAEFGAFVELAPGIEALAHQSTFPPTGRRNAWADQVQAGTTAAFEILSVDLERRRIGVALVPEGSSRAAGSTAASGTLEPGARVTGRVERHERYGVFVFLAPGRVALMPLEESGVERETDLSAAFPVGSEVEVVVLEADATGRRIRVSRKAVREAEDAAELRDYASRADSGAAGGLGSLADKLRGALKRES